VAFDSESRVDATGATTLRRRAPTSQCVSGWHRRGLAWAIMGSSKQANGRKIRGM
jgi:hypothetical protein